MINTPINIVLADDHEIFRDGFRVMMNKIPNIHLTGEATNGEDLIKIASKLKPDVIIIDVKMPVMDGIEATRQLTSLFPEMGIIALSMYDEENLIVDMLEAGARGYLIKNAGKEEIMNAIISVFQHKTYYCQTTSTKLAHMIATSNYHPNKKAVKPTFTEREISIIQLICKELSNKEIAEKLNLSKRTVEGYREKILVKINAKNTVGIVIYAIRHRLLEKVPI